MPRDSSLRSLVLLNFQLRTIIGMKEETIFNKFESRYKFLQVDEFNEDPFKLQEELNYDNIIVVNVS